MFEELEQILGYKFNNIEFLEEALTHPSASFMRNARKINYERLELLGDSILSCVVVGYLFEAHENETEGELSKRKALLVSKSTLYKIAEGMNIGKYMILSSGEEINKGRTNINNLENVLEAIIGAIFLDSNFETVQSFILNIWRELDKQNEKAPTDPKTELQEWTQKYYRELPKYELVSSNGGVFSITLSVSGQDSLSSSGTSMKIIKNKLAEQMLENIKKHIDS
ncbi:ribonuclease 3 [Bacilli bacterium]|nr:ribonuclease 3 [Bacilli bacterium]